LLIKSEVHELRLEKIGVCGPKGLGTSDVKQHISACEINSLADNQYQF